MPERVEGKGKSRDLLRGIGVGEGHGSIEFGLAEWNLYKRWVSMYMIIYR